MNNEIKDELNEDFDIENEEEDLTDILDEDKDDDDIEFEYDDEGNVVIPGNSDDDAHTEEEGAGSGEKADDSDADEVQEEPVTEAVKKTSVKTEAEKTATVPDAKDIEIENLKRQLAERDLQIRDTLKSLGADENEGVAGLERLAAEAEETSVEEYRKKKAEKMQQEEAVKLLQKQRFEEKIRRDLDEVQKAYPETKAYKSVFEFPNFAKFSKFRDAGLTPEEAYIAANPKGVITNAAEAASQQTRNLNNTKSHLRSNVPKGSKDNSITISKKQMTEYKELFPNLSDKEIVALHKQTIKK